MTNPGPGNQTSPRGAHGRYVPSSKTAERVAEALRMRRDCMTYAAIGEALGVSEETAGQWVREALEKRIQEPLEDVRRMELARLDHLYELALKVTQREHAKLYQGVDTGYRDDGPLLAAIDRLIKVSESRRKLLGMDAPTQVEVAGVEIKINGVNLEEL